MPKTNRDLLKRDTAQTVLHLQTALENLALLWKEFDAQKHPMAEGLSDIMSVLEEIKKAVLAFALAAWGLDAEGLEHYRK